MFEKRHEHHFLAANEKQHRYLDFVARVYRFLLASPQFLDTPAIQQALLSQLSQNDSHWAPHVPAAGRMEQWKEAGLIQNWYPTFYFEPLSERSDFLLDTKVGIFPVVVTNQYQASIRRRRSARRQFGEWRVNEGRLYKLAVGVINNQTAGDYDMSDEFGEQQLERIQQFTQPIHIKMGERKALLKPANADQINHFLWNLDISFSTMAEPVTYPFDEYMQLVCKHARMLLFRYHNDEQKFLTLENDASPHKNEILFAEILQVMVKEGLLVNWFPSTPASTLDQLKVDFILEVEAGQYVAIQITTSARLLSIKEREFRRMLSLPDDATLPVGHIRTVDQGDISEYEIRNQILHCIYTLPRLQLDQAQH